jgi:MFS family permease
MSVFQTKTKTVEYQSQSTPSIWGNRNFIILFLSGAIVSLGGKVYELALPLILYEATHSSVVMGTMRAIEFLPNLLLAMFIGVYIDRVNKKKFMQVAILIQIIFLIILYTLVQTGYPYLIFFYSIGFLLMTSNYSYANVRISIVKQVIPRELLTSANAKFSFTITLITIMGPAISGFVLLFSNLHNSLLITSIALIIGLIASHFLKMDEDIKSMKSGLWQEFIDGWRELRSNRPLWLITLIVIFTNASAGMINVMVIFFAKDTLQLDNSQIGLVLSCAGLGGLVGSFLVGYVRKKFMTGPLLGVTLLLNGFTYLIIYLSSDVVLLGLALLLEGIFGTIFSVCVWTLRQETTPSHMIGRVSGITGSMFKIGLPLTMFGAGWIAEIFSASYVFLLAGIMNVLLFIIYRTLPLWKLR